MTFIHERIGTAAIAEEFIEGRELYVSVIGNERLQVLPIWELEFGDLTQGTNRIATAKVKFDVKYQERRGILQGPAEDLSPELLSRINRLTRRICHTLELDGYSRIDFRLNAAGRALFHRGQSQSGNRQARGVCRSGGIRRPLLHRHAAPDSLARHAPRQDKWLERDAEKCEAVFG